MAAPYRHANCYDLAMAATILRNARRIIAVSALIGGALAITASSSEPQTKTAAPQASTAIGDQLMFDVASVKPNKSGNPPTFNFPLGPGDVYVPNGGFLSATNFPLGTYIAFAYKILGNQMQSLMAQLPEWVMTDRFDIQARAESNPGKDQMRLMMRSLLADRFKLAIHTETRGGASVGVRSAEARNDWGTSPTSCKRFIVPYHRITPVGARLSPDTVTFTNNCRRFSGSLRWSLSAATKRVWPPAFWRTKRDDHIHCKLIECWIGFGPPDGGSDGAQRNFRFHYRVRSRRSQGPPATRCRFPT
jgi:hypothetical protein